MVSKSWVQLTVANFSDQAVERLDVQIREDGVDRSAVELTDIAAWSEATKRVRVRFPTAGAHTLSAVLPGDAVEADNVRFLAAEVPDAFDVLVIDGSENNRDSYYFRSAMSPGGAVTTGWRLRTEPPGFLRQQERLDEYAAVVLLDVPRLDAAAISALEKYVRDGGGLAYFVGDRTDPRFANASLYKDGAGLLPAPLAAVTQLRPRRNDDVADLRVGDHPIFRIFAGERNSFLELLLVEFYLAVETGWVAEDEDGVEVIARLRNREPFAIEKRFGQGRVLAVLTKLAPESTPLGRWSNWSLNPVFPVLMNELAGYLSAGKRRHESRAVGQPIQLAFDSAEYLPEVRFEVPALSGVASYPVMASGENDLLTAMYADTNLQGVYRASLERRDGRTAERVFAVNVNAAEGDLRRLTKTDLATALEEIPHEFVWADAYADAPEQLAGFELSDLVLYVLLGVLALEQALAVASSFHYAAPTGANA